MQGVFVYWITNSFCGIGLSTLLRWNQFRGMIGLPPAVDVVLAQKNKEEEELEKEVISAEARNPYDPDGKIRPLSEPMPSVSAVEERAAEEQVSSVLRCTDALPMHTLI
jgi:hypothetical protein